MHLQNIIFQAALIVQKSTETENMIKDHPTYQPHLTLLDKAQVGLGWTFEPKKASYLVKNRSMESRKSQLQLHV